MGNFLIEEKWCKNRYKNDSCDLCRQVCPQAAITQTGIAADKCTDCGLCASICPTRALASKVPYHKTLQTLREHKKIHLTCKKNDQASRFPCLAFADSRLLLALAQQHEVTVDTVACEACSQGICAILQDRIAAVNKSLAKQEKPPVVCQKTVVVPPGEKLVARRDFFKALFGTVFEVADTIKADDLAPSFIRCNFAGLISQEMKEDVAITDLVDTARLAISANCNGCGRCAKLCPQKALQGEVQDGTSFVLKYDVHDCLQCGICKNNCQQNAITFTMDRGAKDTFVIQLPLCETCGKPYQPIGSSKSCFACGGKKEESSGKTDA